MVLTINIKYKDVTIPEAQAIYEFLKENASPYPGMQIYASITQNEPPHIVPEPEPP